ncbi:energy transducer TonB [Sphingomicrobium arenosum]|uniref:energy transducer TonB n=1 Tax=Sphingomicrobium arenosum TaxID=2233861 RepID=UPI002240F7D2|nr:energy transducer TonB [Sphingomicrobium arenosum]
MLAYAPREQQKRQALPLALIAAAHVGAVALFMTLNPGMVGSVKERITEVTFLPKDPPPPPPLVEPVETPPTPAPLPQTPALTVPEPLVPLPPTSPLPSPTHLDPAPVIDPIPAPRVGPSLPTSGTAIVPPLIGATLLTSGADLQPPYPARKIRDGEEAVLQLRLSIDARGRVTAVEPVGNADRDFLRAAERHLKRVWRYAPATKAGEAVASTTVITLRFVLE